jgi:hypothetical protein
MPISAVRPLVPNEQRVYTIEGCNLIDQFQRFESLDQGDDQCAGVTAGLLTFAG